MIQILLINSEIERDSKGATAAGRFVGIQFIGVAQRLGK